MLLQLVETDAVTMNCSIEESTLYDNCYSGHYYDNFDRVSYDHMTACMNNYSEMTNSDCNDHWPKSSCQFVHTGVTSQKEYKSKLKATTNKTDSDPYLSSQCLYRPKKSHLPDQNGQMVNQYTNGLKCPHSCHDRTYISDTHPYDSNDVVIVELNGVKYDIDTSDKMEDQLLEPYTIHPHTGITCPGIPSLPKTIDHDATLYKHGGTSKGCDKSKIKRKIRINKDQYIKQKRLPRSCRLWEFLRGLLLNKEYNPTLIKWINRSAGEFKLVKSGEIAKMWGDQKNNPGMTYEKLSRAMRYYYKREILAPVIGKRLIYRFGKKSYGWQTD